MFWNMKDFGTRSIVGSATSPSDPRALSLLSEEAELLVCILHNAEQLFWPFHEYVQCIRIVATYVPSYLPQGGYARGLNVLEE